MRRFLRNPFTIVGLVLAVFGWGPLLSIIFLSQIGLWPEPNPNPIGPGLLFFFTSWPATICLLIGLVLTLRNMPPNPAHSSGSKNPVSQN